MASKSKSFRIGRVRGDKRGRVWYLTYYEQGQRHRPRVGQDVEAARRQAAEINSQLENEIPVPSSFQSVKISELQTRWLEHHESVARSSVKTIARYRAATSHLLRFIEQAHVPKVVDKFRVDHAEQFVKHLRQLEIAPNGHPHTQKRPLRDKGIRFILEVSRTMFNFAIKRRYLPPNSDNPFTLLQLDRIPVEDSKPIPLFDRDQELAFLKACEWQLPIFLTLMLTGLRPGELSHLFWPDDYDSELNAIVIRNRPALGWQVKTRKERLVPLHPILTQLLTPLIDSKRTGTLFQRQKFWNGATAPLAGRTVPELERELNLRCDRFAEQNERVPSRPERHAIARSVWRDAGLIKTDQIRNDFTRICVRAGLEGFTSPKMLRHLFATTLQEGNVDPLIRNELMGHSTSSTSRSNQLGMTATYTHTRPATMRKQLETALELRIAIAFAREYVKARSTRECDE